MIGFLFFVFRKHGVEGPSLKARMIGMQILRGSPQGA
jgi:hypothetical protein